MQPPSMASTLRMLLLVVLATALGFAAAQLDPATGFITPASGVPDFNPETWNRAYKVTLRGLPSKDAPQTIASRLGSTQGSCISAGFATTSAQGAPMGTCAYEENADGTFDLWSKQRGLALKNGNCYCYALDAFKGDYCVPGTSNGGAGRARYEEKMTCAAILDSVTSDGGVRMSRTQALSGQPDRGHYIVFMARPRSCIPGHCGNPDFHVMRKDSSGTWSWKLPGVPASDRDLEGKLITEPETALLPGHYQVCGYFQVEPSKMVIGVLGSTTGPLADQSALDSFRSQPGVSVDVSPVPYSSSDAVLDDNTKQIFAEDLSWERQRGSQQYEAWRKQQLADLEMGPGGASNDGATAVRRSSSSSSSRNTASGSDDNSTGSSTGSSGCRLSRRLAGLVAA